MGVVAAPTARRKDWDELPRLRRSPPGSLLPVKMAGKERFVRLGTSGKRRKERFNTFFEAASIPESG